MKQLYGKERFQSQKDLPLLKSVSEKLEERESEMKWQ
jgi:hypothetical protein